MVAAVEQTKISINGVITEMPTRWNELTLEQVLYIYGILMTDTANILEPQELIPTKKMLIIQSLLKLDMTFMKSWEEDCINAYGEDGKTVFLQELSDILSTVDFLFEKLEKQGPDEPDRYQIKLGLTTCPYGVIAFEKKSKKKENWYAPANELDNITIYEMGTAFTLFEHFMKDKDEAYAEELIATLYRPSKANNSANKKSGYHGDRRLPLLHHEGMVKKRKPKIQLLPKPVKQIIIFWFACCRHKIIHDFPNVFTGGQEGDKSGNQYGWGGVLLSLADGLVNLDEISGKNHYDALTYLSYLEDQRKVSALRKR